jgi:hypothetical protein
MSTAFRWVRCAIFVLAASGCGSDRVYEGETPDASSGGQGGAAGHGGTGTGGAAGSVMAGGGTAGGGTAGGSAGSTGGTSNGGTTGSGGTTGGTAGSVADAATDAPSSDAKSDARGDAPAETDARTPDACALNACGGCGTLAAAPGATCGTGCGHYVCSADKSSVSCSDPAATGCCIGGTAVTAGTIKSDNTCMDCSPAKSTTAWSPRTTCGNGNAGCTCAAGVPKEAACSDGTDNDGDTKADCADADCDAKVCLDKTGDAKPPSTDFFRTTIENGTITDHDGTAVLNIYRGGSSGPHPYQSSLAQFSFANLPQITAATITKATLRFYYTNTVATTLEVRDGDSGALQCSATLPVQGSLTAFDCDVTSSIVNWFATNLRVELRSLRASTPSFGDQDINVSATEGPAATAPRLLLNYQTKCTSMSCPGL